MSFYLRIHSAPVRAVDAGSMRRKTFVFFSQFPVAAYRGVLQARDECRNESGTPSPARTTFFKLTPAIWEYCLSLVCFDSVIVNPFFLFFHNAALTKAALMMVSILPSIAALCGLKTTCRIITTTISLAGSIQKEVPRAPPQEYLPFLICLTPS